MHEATSTLLVRPLEDTDLGAIVAIDEKISGAYRPEVWESRLRYYTRRDPEASAVAEIDGRVVGFMLGEVRSGEFGLEEPSGWVEVVGVDPDCRRQSIGQGLAERMFQHFRRRGVKTVRTLVDGGMEEIGRFFEALGFETEGLRALRKTL